MEFKFLTNAQNKINLYRLCSVGKELIEDQLKKAVFESSEENEEAVKRVVVETGKDDSRQRRSKGPRRRKKKR